MSDHQEPNERVSHDWTADRVRYAESLADGGNLRLAADLCEAMRADERVSRALTLRARGGLSLFAGFERSASSKRNHSQAERMLEAEEDWYTIAPDEHLAKLEEWAIILGVGIAQLVWPGEVNSRGRLVPTLDAWSPRNLRRNSEGQWVVRTTDGDVIAAPGDRSWVIHTPADSKRPWSTAPWRAVARWWLLTQFARQDMSRHSERAAGFVVAVPPMPSGVANLNEAERKTQKARLAQDLAEMGRNGSVVLPAGYNTNLVQAAANTHATFTAQIELAAQGITIALSGQNLTTQVSGGSLAAAKVHERVEQTLLDLDASSRSRTLHDQVLVHWAEYNLRGGAAAAPWPVWDTTPPEDVQTTAQGWNSALDAMAKAKTLGMELDADEVARRTRMPLRKQPTP